MVGYAFKVMRIEYNYNVGCCHDVSPNYNYHNGACFMQLNIDFSSLDIIRTTYESFSLRSFSKNAKRRAPNAVAVALTMCIAMSGCSTYVLCFFFCFK